jgi:hypothetical protein
MKTASKRQGWFGALLGFEGEGIQRGAILLSRAASDGARRYTNELLERPAKRCLGLVA